MCSRLGEPGVTSPSGRRWFVDSCPSRAEGYPPLMTGCIGPGAARLRVEPATCPPRSRQGVERPGGRRRVRPAAWTVAQRPHSRASAGAAARPKAASRADGAVRAAAPVGVPATLPRPDRQPARRAALPAAPARSPSAVPVPRPQVAATTGRRHPRRGRTAAGLPAELGARRRSAARPPGRRRRTPAWPDRRLGARASVRRVRRARCRRALAVRPTTLTSGRWRRSQRRRRAADVVAQRSMTARSRVGPAVAVARRGARASSPRSRPRAAVGRPVRMRRWRAAGAALVALVPRARRGPEPSGRSCRRACARVHRRSRPCHADPHAELGGARLACERRSLSRATVSAASHSSRGEAASAPSLDGRAVRCRYRARSP